jgi:hypothetical protein
MAARNKQRRAWINGIDPAHKETRMPPAVRKVKEAMKKDVAKMTAGTQHPRSRKVQAAVRAEKKAKGVPVTEPRAKTSRHEGVAEKRPKEATVGLVPWKPGQSGNPNGRPAGIVSRVSRLTGEERLALARKYNVTPLEFLLSVMADHDEPMDARIDAAKAAAPYMHRKMPIGIELPNGGMGTVDMNRLRDMPEEELDAALDALAKLGLILPAIAGEFVR